MLIVLHLIWLLLEGAIHWLLCMNVFVSSEQDSKRGMHTNYTIDNHFALPLIFTHQFLPINALQKLKDSGHHFSDKLQAIEGRKIYTYICIYVCTCRYLSMYVYIYVHRHKHICECLFINEWMYCLVLFCWHTRSLQRFQRHIRLLIYNYMDMVINLVFFEMA